RLATETQAEAIRSMGLVAEVQAVYLDDSPEVPEAYMLTTAPNLIAIPYFLALGSHNTIDVPAELSLPAGQTTGFINGRRVYYTHPVGTDEALLDVILELAREVHPDSSEYMSTRVGATHESPPQTPSTRGGSNLHSVERENTPRDVWTNFPTAGRDMFVDAVFER